MPNNAFDRTILNRRDPPSASDCNQWQSQMDRTIREQAQRFYSIRNTAIDPSSVPAYGFIGDSFQVVAESVLFVANGIFIKPGIGFLPSVDGIDNPLVIPSNGFPVGGLSDLSPYKPVEMNNGLDFPVPPNVGANPRIDIVEIAYQRQVTNSSTREIFDIGTDTFQPGLVNKTLSFNLDGTVIKTNATAAINYKIGTPTASPTSLPAGTSHYTPLAYIYVPGTSQPGTFFTQASVIDARQLLMPGGIIPVSFVVTVPFSGKPTLSALNAPPGVTVGVVGNQNGAINPSEVRCFIFAGKVLVFSDTLTAVNGDTGVSIATQVADTSGGTTGTAGIGKLSVTKFVGAGHPIPPGTSLLNGTGTPKVRQITQAEAGWLENSANTASFVEVAPNASAGWPADTLSGQPFGQPCLTFAMMTVTAANAAAPVFGTPITADYPMNYYVTANLRTL